jgi:precorrin-6B methylase 2
MDLVSLLRRPFAWGLKRLDLDALYSLKRRGPLAEDGWFRSNRENASVDASGSPLPWMTYPAIEFIRKRVKPDMSVFEYGSGGSTIWWANQVREVISVEHDRAWFEKVAKDVGSRALVYQIDLIPGGGYSGAIQKFDNRFDVVVVDGRDRVNCTKNCLQALKSTGIIILDNSDRPEYAEAFEFLHSNGFRHIEFVGLCPIVNLKCETSIFYRSGNRFGI